MAREMKDSGIDWIGDIPSEWSFVKLCYMCEDMFLGATPVYSEEPTENYIIGQKNNQGSQIVLNEIKYGTDDFFQRRPHREILKYNDILLNTLGTGSVGRVGIWSIDDGKKYITDGHIMIIRSQCSYSAKYIYYTLCARQRELEDMAVGSTNQAFLTVNKIYKIVQPRPQFEEQKRIAGFLDKECARIDEVVEKTRASIEEYKKLKQSIITEAVTKGIRKNRPMIDSGSAWFGRVPKEWNMSKLKYLFHIKKNIAGKEGYAVLSITQKGIVPKDLSKNEGQIAANYSNYQLVEPGDFAMNHMDLLTGWIDISKYSGVTSPDYRVFALNDTNSNDSHYYLYMMQMCYSNKIFYGLGQGVSGMGRWRLQADKFLNFGIPVPPYNEQVEIARYLDRKILKFDKLIEKKEKLLLELDVLKKSLIYEYVTGKKEVV